MQETRGQVRVSGPRCTVHTLTQTCWHIAALESGSKIREVYSAPVPSVWKEPATLGITSGPPHWKYLSSLATGSSDPSTEHFVNTQPSQRPAVPQDSGHTFKRSHFYCIYQMTFWGQRPVGCFISLPLAISLYIFLLFLILRAFWITRLSLGCVYFKSACGVEVTRYGFVRDWV